MIPTSQIVTWTLETDERAHWALFVRTPDETMRLSPWYAQKADLLRALSKSLGVVSVDFPA